MNCFLNYVNGELELSNKKAPGARIVDMETLSHSYSSSEMCSLSVFIKDGEIELEKDFEESKKTA